MKFLLLPDSFKGSITAKRACEILEKAICDNVPGSVVKKFPALDGGEGSSEQLTEIFGGRTVGGKVNDGNFFVKTATYGVTDDTAFIAVANSSGLPETMIKDPAFTTTYGLGQQIEQAIVLKKSKIVIALGGSSTNDGGAGAAAALGAKFFNKNGEEFVPTGGTLKDIENVDLTEFNEKIKGTEFLGLCDVSNPLTGDRGCSYVYAKQKGAKTAEQRNELEMNMKIFAEKTSFLGVSETESGTGAAGGLGYFVKAFLKGKLVSGADYFLDAVNFEEECKTADYVICGEGKFDSTSTQGKICGRIISRANAMGVSPVVFCGISEGEKPDGVRAVYEIADPNMTLDENMAEGEYNLFKSALKFTEDIVK